MEMGDSGDLPRVTSHSARAETRDVVDQVVDDHFDDLEGRGSEDRKDLLKNTLRVHSPDYRQGSVPNFVNEWCDR